MFEGVLRDLRERIRQRRYVVTLHAEEEMSDDALSVYDVERAILTGEILEAQRNGVTGERKYRIRGESTARHEIELIAKLGPTGKAVVITVYRL